MGINAETAYPAKDCAIATVATRILLSIFAKISMFIFQIIAWVQIIRWPVSDKHNRPDTAAANLLQEQAGQLFELVSVFALQDQQSPAFKMRSQKAAPNSTRRPTIRRLDKDVDSLLPQ